MSDDDEKLEWGDCKGFCHNCLYEGDDSEKELRLWFDWFLCKPHWEHMTDD